MTRWIFENPWPLIAVLTVAGTVAIWRGSVDASRLLRQIGLVALLLALAAYFGGRIVVMSYQSGEDRLTKQELRRRSHTTAPLGLPRELPEHRAEFTELTRGAEMASPEEIAHNPRAASVRLRAAEKLRKVTR
jgi:hypothetical protein